MMSEATERRGGSSSPATLPELLELGAKLHAEQLAVVAPERVPLTHRALYQETLRLERELLRRGISRGDCVAAVMSQGPDLLLMFLGVASFGCYAPLNPDYSEEEFRFVLEDLRARVALVEQGRWEAARRAAASLGLPVVDVYSRTGDPAGALRFEGDPLVVIGSPVAHEREPASSGRAPDDLAMVLHTSGTTARPKIVALSQANICASARNSAVAHRLTTTDRCLNLMPLFHVHGLISASLASLSAGGSVICPPRFEARSFFEWAAAYVPTWYTASPTMHCAILEAAPRDPAAVPSLAFVRSSSAPLAPSILESLSELFRTPVIEYYGMSECASKITSNPRPPGVRKVGSVGTPAGVRVRVMREDGKPCASGELGEIEIAGESVMRGYLRNDAANRSAFRNGWLRTGDQGYLDEDGYLFITGRLKELINRGGEKIAPREVDEVLMDHPAVQQALAFAVPHPTLGEDMVAAVVLREPLDVEELRRFAFERLARYKVPSQIIAVKALPKGPSGKLKRVGLASVLERELRPKVRAPAGETEPIVAAVWQVVLHAECVNADDNFFMLGGDSLSAVQVVAQLRERLGITLRIEQVFDHPTVASLSAVIAAARRAGSDPEDME